eukprot:jgi/Psemu1/46842/gm1.46842_g
MEVWMEVRDRRAGSERNRREAISTWVGEELGDAVEGEIKRGGDGALKCGGEAEGWQKGSIPQSPGSKSRFQGWNRKAGPKHLAMLEGFMKVPLWDPIQRAKATKEKKKKRQKNRAKFAAKRGDNG